MMKVVYGSPLQLLKINSVDLECYILDDDSRILGKNKLEKTFGLDSKLENSLFNFISNIARFNSVSDELLLVLQTPIQFQITLDDQAEKTLSGFNASILIALCNCIVIAKTAGFLSVNQLKTAKTSEKILKGLENKLLHNLIDEATGFTFFKENAKEQFKNYFLKVKNDPAFEWVVTFTDSFYEDLFHFMESGWSDLRYNPSKIADFIYSIVFLRIDDKVLDDLRASKPKRSYVNKNGVLLNREHLKLQLFNQSLHSFFIESGFERSEFMQLLIKNYPKNTLRENLIFETIEAESLTLFNEKLKIGLTVKK